MIMRKAEGKMPEFEKEQHAPEINLGSQFDPHVWVEEWLKAIDRRPTIPMEKGAMLGWFASAIMAGYDHARQEPMPYQPGQPEPTRNFADDMRAMKRGAFVAGRIKAYEKTVGILWDLPEELFWQEGGEEQKRLVRKLRSIVLAIAKACHKLEKELEERGHESQEIGRYWLEFMELAPQDFFVPENELSDIEFDERDTAKERVFDGRNFRFV